MSQQMPIDITSPTPPEHGSAVSCSQSQPTHAGKFIIMEMYFQNLNQPSNVDETESHNRILR